jgi:putative restriction endonuclease
MEIIENYKIDIDTITVNYSDSAVSENLKLKLYTGVGEKRIYIATSNDCTQLDEFFFRNTNGTCFMLKDDLLIYLRDAYYEYKYPTQDYKEYIGKFYNDLIGMVNNLPDKITISFTKTYDNRNRYYLVCEKEYRSNLNILASICLPQITKLSFVKFIDTTENEIYIQLRPFFFRSDLTGSNHPNFKLSFSDDKILDLKYSNLQTEKYEDELIPETQLVAEDDIPIKASDRPWQVDWKTKLINDTMHCAISKCSEDRILIGCHIKPVAICLKEKCGNEINPKNGIMLVPTFHKLFDDGYLSFDNQNRLLLSSHISVRNYERLNLRNNQVTSILKIEDRIDFLKWHRETIFKG